MESIVMTIKEADRYDIIKNLISRKLNGSQAAKQLNLSIRQIKRLKRRVEKEGIKGIIHKNRGKESNHKISDETREKTIKLIKEKYTDFTPALAQEKLEKSHHIAISYGTVRNLMISENIRQPKKRKNNLHNYHSQRPRKDHYGEMQQFDGSYHDWLEGRGRNNELCLLASIDDATGKITHAKLDKNESIQSVFGFWQEYLMKNGKPIAIYLDKYSTYKINHKNAVDNKDLLTQFQRAMQELDVNPISANSPQAKGRIERLFGTLQDRLVKELRLNEINDIDSANQFIQKKFITQFNEKFSVQSRKKGDLHRKISKRKAAGKLNHILSVKNQRIVRNDFVIQYKNRYFQLNEIQPTTVYKKDKIVIEEHLDEAIHINKKEAYLNFTELKEKPEKEIDIKLPAIALAKAQYIPPADHPWRKHIFNQKQESVKV